ncbi:MAG TPA: 50S ribosomal protein L9 [Polyangiales bacterium]|jgi:large subunit ribosomal protein L9|nr:50S ribosomal protein L9 [Polyangiales bacterium]
MANHVHVILKQDIDKVGSAGELIRVKPGFARNYLLPRSLAVVATSSNVKQIEHERKLAVAAAAKQKSVAEGHAAQVQGLTLEIAMQAGEGDKLFGSVTSRDVSDALKKRGIELDRKHIELPEGSIKALGDFDVTAKMGSGVNATFKVRVTKSS